jgi:hypothetical protein
MSGKVAAAGDPCISRRSPRRCPGRVSAVLHASAARPNGDSPGPPLSGCGISAPCRRLASPATWPGSTSLCTYPGEGLRVEAALTPSPSRQHTREHDPEPTVRLRELQPPRPGRCSTCSWCRKASPSSWSAVRERADVRRVRRRDKHRHNCPEAYPSSGCKINCRHKERPFQ